MLDALLELSLLFSWLDSSARAWAGLLSSTSLAVGSGEFVPFHPLRPVSLTPASPSGAQLCFIVPTESPTPHRWRGLCLVPLLVPPRVRGPRESPVDQCRGAGVHRGVAGSPDWLFYMLLTSMPTFMSSVLHFDLSENGLLSSLPYIGNGLGHILAGLLADFLLARRVLGTAAVRKLFSALGMLLPSIFLVAVPYIGCSSTAAVVLLTLALTIISMTGAGININHIDIAPRLARKMLALLILAGAAHADEFKMFLLAEDLGGLVHCREGAGSTCSSFQFLLCPAQEIFASSLQVRRVPARSHKYPWHNLRDYCTYCSRASRQPGSPCRLEERLHRGCSPQRLRPRLLRGVWQRQPAALGWGGAPRASRAARWGAAGGAGERGGGRRGDGAGVLVLCHGHTINFLHNNTGRACGSLLGGGAGALLGGGCPVPGPEDPGGPAG
ncbi:uncharacterized protein [Anas platyrhynchos]|uniref:uncharacterized protein isoform X3 n=1 Tax=Anas platyrhynchos TaxID=8839 RepID=UPI003AF2A9EF